MLDLLVSMVHKQSSVTVVLIQATLPCSTCYHHSTQHIRLRYHSYSVNGTLCV